MHHTLAHYAPTAPIIIYRKRKTTTYAEKCCGCKVFPDLFKMVVPDTQVRKQAGNSVVIPKN